MSGAQGENPIHVIHESFSEKHEKSIDTRLLGFMNLLITNIFSVIDSGISGARDGISARHLREFF